MADPDDEVPTAEQLEARLNDLAQIYDLGIALRDLRFLDADETRKSLHKHDRVTDIGPEGSAGSNAPSGEKPAP